MRSETKWEISTALEVGTELDSTSRRLFMNKEILAPLLQMAVPEYAGYTALQVMRTFSDICRRYSAETWRVWTGISRSGRTRRSGRSCPVC